jgi:malate permease and related proteins
MGLPLALLAFGATGLSMAVALFIAGSLAFFTVGIKIIESGRGGTQASFFTFLASPMMLAILVGMAFSILRIPVPATLFTPMKMLGDACIPIMLFALGVRMIDVDFRCWRIGLAGAVLCPLSGLLVALVLDRILTLTALQRGQMYLFASLPPAVLTFMVAEQYQQEPDHVAAIVLLGNLGALASVPLGLWLGMRAA